MGWVEKTAYHPKRHSHHPSSEQMPPPCVPLASPCPSLCPVCLPFPCVFPRRLWGSTLPVVALAVQSPRLSPLSCFLGSRSNPPTQACPPVPAHGNHSLVGSVRSERVMPAGDLSFCTWFGGVGSGLPPVPSGGAASAVALPGVLTGKGRSRCWALWPPC